MSNLLRRRTRTFAPALSLRFMRGRLIAFEGIDGCGKTTQARLLKDRLGEDAVLTFEPGATALGEELRQLLLGASLRVLSHEAEALLLAADRAEHVAALILPAIEDGKWVVTDRYVGSTLAYQGYGRGIDLHELRKLSSFATGGLRPDLSVLMDVPLDVARERMRGHAADRLEKLGEDFHTRVRDGYIDLASADPPHWVVIDGTRSVDEIASAVQAEIEARLGPLPVGTRSADEQAG